MDGADEHERVGSETMRPAVARSRTPATAAQQQQQQSSVPPLSLDGVADSGTPDRGRGSRTPLKPVHGDGYLIILRHGQSIWNLDPREPTKDWRYAGTADVPLSTLGVEEALEAAERMKNYRIDQVFTSALCRATTTAFLALGKHHDRRPVVWYRDAESYRKAKRLAPNAGGGKGGATVAGANGAEGGAADAVPLVSSAALNERCFGEMEGVLSSQHVTPTRTKEMLKRARNSYRVPFQGGESAHDVFNRAVPYFVKEVLPLLLQGRNVLIVTHGFVVRALTKFLEEMDDATFEAEMELEKTAPERCRLLAPTGAPLVYRVTDVGRRSFERIESADDIAALLSAPQQKGVAFERLAGDLGYEVSHSDAPAL